MKILATADLHIRNREDCALLARILQKAQEQAAGIPDAVVSWLAQKLQFKGYSITYNSDGTISIEQNGIWAQNVKPSVALLKALKDGSYHVQIHAINPRDDWAA